jgi:N-acetylglucosamine kinase-like BadF-type ATPase
MAYFLAIDGGGSKTQVICTDESGQVVGEGFSGPTSLAVTNAGAASFNLKEAIRQAVEKLPPEVAIEKVAMGLAGMDTPEEALLAKNTFTPWFEPFHIKEFILVNDIEIALEGGTSAQDAVALISGTGSNCYGRNQAGQVAKAGGMDWLLADQGSGYSIGRAVLRMAVKSYDGRMRKTQLEQFICEHFHITNISELKAKVYNPPLTKTEVAELAQLCLRGFDQGDEVAKGIFDHAISELVIMSESVLSRLNLQAVPVDFVLAGSITKISYIQTQLITELKKMCPQINMIVPTAAPVFGALKLVMKA